MKTRAIVIGGSLGGLFAANLLQDLGWDVDVFERVGDELASRGAGIGTHDELLAVLGRLGIEIDDRFGVRVAERICLDHAGNPIYRVAWGHMMSAWARIYRPLKDRLAASHYHPGRNFTDLTRDHGEIVAHFDDGSQARADLLIGADGLRSTVRARVSPGAKPVYAGYVGWRGVVEESAIPARVRDCLGVHYYFVLPPGEMMLCYPVPGRDNSISPGHRDWNYVWYRPTATQRELRDLCTDVNGRHYGTAIPPPLVRPDATRKIKDLARSTLAPQIAEIVELSQPFFQAIFDVESPRIALERVALLGDAAFVARPHVGMGVTKAGLDALCLAKSIAHANGDLDGALDRYDRLRGEFGRRCVARGRRIGSYIEARARPEAGWTPEAIDQSPERILREVGATLSDIPEFSLEI
jgi:2-polyprenyl-6-methoxyphenol hydroxylase-like FAD-dependent oxidoreductase